MPSRGQYWKIGGLNDLHIVEADLDSALQAKVNSGGGGSGLFYTSFIINAGGDHSPFGPSVASFLSGESNNLDGAIMRAGKVTKIWVTVHNGGASPTNLNFRKNNANSGSTVSWDNTDNGTVVKNTEDRTFAVDDEISFRVTGTVSPKATVVVEWDFS